jgi:hypothetical protein
MRVDIKFINKCFWISLYHFLTWSTSNHICKIWWGNIYPIIRHSINNLLLFFKILISKRQKYYKNEKSLKNNKENLKNKWNSPKEHSSLFTPSFLPLLLPLVPNILHTLKVWPLITASYTLCNIKSCRNDKKCQNNQKSSNILFQSNIQ